MNWMKWNWRNEKFREFSMGFHSIKSSWKNERYIEFHVDFLIEFIYFIHERFIQCVTTLLILRYLYVRYPCRNSQKKRFFLTIEEFLICKILIINRKKLRQIDILSFSYMGISIMDTNRYYNKYDTC